MDEETPLHVAAAEVRTRLRVHGDRLVRCAKKRMPYAVMKRMRRRLGWTHCRVSPVCRPEYTFRGQEFWFWSVPSPAIQGVVEAVRLLLQAGASPAAVDKAGYTPLHWAAGKGHEKVVEVRRSQTGSISAPVSRLYATYPSPNPECA